MRYLHPTPQVPKGVERCKSTGAGGCEMAELRTAADAPLGDAAVLHKFDSAVVKISPAAERNNRRWAASTFHKGFSSPRATMGVSRQGDESKARGAPEVDGRCTEAIDC